MPPVAKDLVADVLGRRGRLIVVSNRGPLTFELDPDAPGGLTAARGSGGLVTALAELGRHAPVTWIAASRTPGDEFVAPLLSRLSRERSDGVEPAADEVGTGPGAVDDGAVSDFVRAFDPDGEPGVRDIPFAVPTRHPDRPGLGWDGVAGNGSRADGHTPLENSSNGNGFGRRGHGPGGTSGEAAGARLPGLSAPTIVAPDAAATYERWRGLPAEDTRDWNDAEFEDLARHRRDGRATIARVHDLVNGLLPNQDIELRLETLPPDVRHRHYEVVANPVLWFLQHQMYALPYGPNIDADLVAAWRTGYRSANRLMAEAAVEAAGDVTNPTFLVQDYHFYLVPERIRELRPDATILHFTHIPWPPASLWHALPQGMRRAICEGILAADIVGLQTDRYASNFLEAVASFVRDARVDGDGRTIRWRGRRIRVAAYPISLDPDALNVYARSAPVEERVSRLRTRLERAGNPRLIVRADRIEPSKNALRGFLAFEDLLRRQPELRQTVRFVAVQAPTRTALPEYAAYASAVREVVARINGMAEPDDQPVWIYDGSDYAMAIAALRLADVVLVNPVIDGMNLVAKEGVLIGERDPVLVLSETAGAAEQLASSSLSVGPTDIVGTSEALGRALTLAPEERRGRLKRLRQSVRDEDIGWWLNRQLRDLAAVRRGERPPSRRLRDAVRMVDVPLD